MMKHTSIGLVCLSILILSGCPDESSPSTNNPTPKIDMADKDMSDKDMSDKDMAKKDMPTTDMAGKDMSDKDMKGDMADKDMSDMSSQGPLTYYQNVKPIIDQNCVNCHSDGQIAPFNLDTYALVKPMAASIKAAVANETMPPWMPRDDCGDFSYKRDLTPTQAATIKKWVDDGALEGDPNATPDEQPGKETVMLGTPDLSIDIGTDYKPNPPANKTDDYRCFVVDPQLASDKYLNAFRTKPGNPAVVHHMLLFNVARGEKAKLDQLAAAEPNTPGYTCFGGTKVGNSNLLGVWAPGVVPVKFPEGHGIPIKKDDLLVIQVHYNTLNNDAADRTGIDLFFTPNLTTKLAMLPIADNNLDIKAGDANAVEGSSYSIPNLPIQLKLYGVVPHMHALGKQIKVELERGGQKECLVDIPKWDFNWQSVYLYKDPIVIKGGDKISLTCIYDNSPERNMANGNPQPRDVQWGDGTYDEMCLNYAIVEDIR